MDRKSDALTIREDDLSGSMIQELVQRHLRGMYESSPPESVHAFDLVKLRQPGVTFWSGWIRGEAVETLAVMGALKRLDTSRGEIKSMRVHDALLGKGFGRAMLRHIMKHARETGLSSLWLETGSTPHFEAALRLYESEGFAYCRPFDAYKPDPFSRFMMREI